MCGLKGPKARLRVERSLENAVKMLVCCFRKIETIDQSHRRRWSELLDCCIRSVSNSPGRKISCKLIEGRSL